MDHTQTPPKGGKETRSDQIFESLRDQICREEYAPGDRLPSEGELARQYEVSRTSVRMALQKLAALGLIETVNGGGSYVKQFVFSEVVGNFSGPLSQGISFEDMNQYRYVIEEKAIGNLRGRKLIARDADYLRACLARMEQAAEKQDDAGFAEADYDFHRYICVLSGNKMFVYSYDMCRSVYIEYLGNQYNFERYRSVHGEEKTASVLDGYKSACRSHRQMLACLESGEIEECLSILREFTGYR